MQCLFCHSSNIDNAGFPRPTQFNNKIFHYKKCRDCGLVFIDPIPVAEDYNVMYTSSYHEQFYFKDVIPDQTEWFDLFQKFSKEKKLLDYGCGDASFLKFFHQKGYECTGVEYDPELVNRLRKENPGINFFTVDQFWKEQSEYNIIFMGDVLEHIATPSVFLSDLGARLATSGLMAAQGPLENNLNLALSVRKFFSSLKGRNAAAQHVPYHISFSTAKNQEAVFQRAGLKTKYYKVFETTWPFPNQFSFSPAKGFQYIVAKTSIVLSKALPGKMGNRFMYIGEKK
jgi:2-polyprenyl-3-methyl-5-hydroxy-6-metoxy-1,4-benzoquinol methylase